MKCGVLRFGRDDVIDLLQKCVLILHGAAEGLTIVSAEKRQLAVKVPATDEHAFSGAAVGKVGRAEAEADLPAEVAVLRAVGRAALRQKIGERAAEFLLCEKRGELCTARVV